MSNVPKDLTTGSLNLLIELWRDRGNWNGMPLWDPPFQEARVANGHLTDLKKKGYVTTEEDYENPSLVWVSFTDKAAALFVVNV